MEHCLVCGRRIGLMKHGQFHKHNIRRGEVCTGSWEWPHKQISRLTMRAADGANAPRVFQVLNLDSGEFENVAVSQPRR